MILQDLPPTGNPIDLSGGHRPVPSFEGYTFYGLDSGTSALAMAFILAVKQRPDIQHPEVILPAYGCPDLIAAAEYAGVAPRLVDICSEADPRYDLTQLALACGEHTVAVLAVNFLGVRERIEAIRESVPSTVTVIEDNAQWFPEGERALLTDMAITSFGRGKPVSLLGGGGLYIREGSGFDLQGGDLKVGAPTFSRLTSRLKMVTYNCLLNPFLYLYVNRNPWVTLGQTVFHPLTGIRAMDTLRSGLLATNIERYYARGRAFEAGYDQYMASASEHYAPLTALDNVESGRLLRYPLVCRDAALRCRVQKMLHRHGLGASVMYNNALADISGVAHRLAEPVETPNACAFSQRLLTLPLHCGVKAKHISAIRSILESARPSSTL